ncbi:efflux RND transporter permease subunit [Plantibacter sp. Mn2098]|uniref:efflux RND transporter permease subunit n=1 Tax=Plantibacter sp. Mn2098 TaxID=3395266 RepID=UPI003BCDFD75
MHFLSVLSMKNRALIALVTIVVAVFGGLAVSGLKQELVPSVQFPQLAIVTSYPGAAPEVVNDDVSTPMETAIQGVPGLESTSATSSTNSSLVSATFTYGTDLATAEQKINQAINRIKSTLPSDLDPQVVSGSIDDLPVIQIAVTGGGSSDALATLLKNSVVPDIKDVSGVRDAAIVGDIGKRISITPDPEKLAAIGKTSQVVSTTLQQNGVLLPAGSITENNQTLSVQTGSKLGSVDDIKALPIAGAANASGGVVTLGDVADIALTDDPITSISRVDGKPALTVAVTKLPSANTVEVSQGVRALLPDLEKTIGSDAKLTVVFDQAPYIEQSIESLTTEGLLGLVFAVLIILVFLLDVRATIVTAISIPTSVLITFIGLQVAEYSLNILTLGALTIAIGRVVDDSIVVIENIKRHLSFGENRTGAERAESILSAVREVAGAITASTATTVAVFLPIAFVGDMTGELFRPFALTVTIALLASLLVALTIVPVLAYWFLRAPKKRAETAAAAADATAAVEAEPAEAGTSRRARRNSSVQDEDDLEKPSRLQRGYLPIIHWTLRHSFVTILLALLVLGGTLALTPFMKTNFLGSSGQNTLSVTQTLKVGASLEAQDNAASQVEAKLRSISGIETVQLSIGSSGSSLRDAFVGGGSGSITYSITTDENVDQTALQKRVRTDLAGIPDAGEIEVTASSGFGGSSDIEVDITSPRQADLQTASDTIQKAVEKLKGIDQVSSNLSASRPYIQIKVNRDEAAKAGYTEVALGSFVSQLMQPTTAGTIAIDDTTLTIYVDTQNPPTTIADLAAATVPTVAGPLRLDQLATVSQVDGPASITTVKGLRSATISATPASDNLSAASGEVQAAVDQAKLPAGTVATLGGVTSDQSNAFSQLGLAMLAAILIVYIIMVATFRSLRQPILLLVSVPFAATGAIGLQVLTGVPLGVPSLIGVLMLIGIVVTNAIVLVDLVNQYRRRGMDVITAVEHGAARRLRPILMTALATIFALTPMALGVTGHGGFISQPLAIVVIGGLVSSTILTLVVLPTLYNLVEGAKERRAAKRAAKAAGAGAGADADVAVAEVEAAPAVAELVGAGVGAGVGAAGVSALGGAAAAADADAGAGAADGPDNAVVNDAGVIDAPVNEVAGDFADSAEGPDVELPTTAPDGSVLAPPTAATGAIDVVEPGEPGEPAAVLPPTTELGSVEGPDVERSLDDAPAEFTDTASIEVVEDVAAGTESQDEIVSDAHSFEGGGDEHHGTHVAAGESQPTTQAIDVVNLTDAEADEPEHHGLHGAEPVDGEAVADESPVSEAATGEAPTDDATTGDGATGDATTDRPAPKKPGSRRAQWP